MNESTRQAQAEREINEVIQAALAVGVNSLAPIALADVRRLMITAWLRGATAVTEPVFCALCDQPVRAHAITCPARILGELWGDDKARDAYAWIHAAYVDEVVARFLSWPLPPDFAPDAGIAFTPIPVPTGHNPAHYWPIGTNLLTAAQARAMLNHILNFDPPI